MSCNNNNVECENVNENKGVGKRSTAYSRGQATLFGFKRRPATAPSAIPSVDNAAAAAAAVANAITDHGSLTSSQESLNSISPISSGKSTPRLSRPKKDVDGNNSIRTNRFGFRAPAASSITNKVGDSNCNNVVTPSAHVASHTNQEYRNILNTEKPRAKGGGKLPAPKIKETSLPIPNSRVDVNKSKSVRSFIPQPGSNHEQAKASKFTLQTTQLPKPQYPIRLSSADADVKRSSKIAKTVANNSTRKVCQGFVEDSSSKEGSVNDDSGIGSHQSTAMSNGETDTLHGIEILDSSPTFGFRRYRNVQKPRALEVVVNGQCFDVRDLKDDDSSADDPNVITEISLISLPQIPCGSKPSLNTGLVRERSILYERQIANDSTCDNMHQEECLSTPSSDEFHTDERLEQEEGEEKVFQDSSRSEKSTIDKGLITPGSMEEEDWGHGEAMAEEFSSSSDDGRNNCNFSAAGLKLNDSVIATESSHNPRPVVLKIEDPLFAAFAAAGASSLIDDEKSPVDSLISSSPPTSSVSEDVSEEHQKSLLQDDGNKRPDSIATAGENLMQRSSNTLSPDSPGTPTNASNSLSLSEGRDFLIDDEIADQPGLMFDDAGTAGGDMVTSSAGCSSLLLSITENTTTLVDSTPKPVPRRLATSLVEGSPSPCRGRHVSQTGSVDTLSPCESITSDDLMMDFERSEGSAFDCTAESHPDSSGGHNVLDDSTVGSELDERSEAMMKEWSTLLGAHIRDAGLVTGRPRLLRSRTGSTPESPRSLDSKPKATGSPLRPSRPSTGSENDDGGVWLDRHTYHSICQDIVNHKTMLLKLMRHLQKDEENSLTRAETLNPFDSSLKNGLFYNLASTDGPAGDGDETGQSNSRSPQEEVADLRRQVVFLQQQLEEEQHTVQLLQLQMTKHNNIEAASIGNAPPTETCNAATQTERVRPVSAGPSLLQSLPSENNMGPLVSSTDTWGRRRQPSLGDLGVGRTASRLPGLRPIRRTNLPPTGFPGTTEQSNIPSRKLTALALTSSALSHKVPTPIATSTPVEGHAAQLNKT